MTYRKKIATFFIAYSLFLSLIYSGLIIGSLFIIEDRLYEHFLNKYFVKVEQQQEGLNSQSTQAPLVVSEVYAKNNIPQHLQGLPEGITELDDTHILVKTLNDDQSLFLSMPEFGDLIDNIIPFALTLLIIIGGIISLIGIMIAVLLARQLSLPIEKLVSDVKQASINTTHIADSSDSTELNLLTQAFNEAMLRISMALEREKGFTQSVSHELRTPLTVLKTNLAILQSHKEPEKVMENVTARMFRATQNMGNLTDTFLALARHDKFAMKKTSFSPAEVIKSVIQNTNNPSINWLVECKQTTKIKASEKMFEILIANIVDNANKYAIDTANIVVTDNYLETYNTIKHQGQNSGSSQLGLKIIERICQAFDWQMKKNMSGSEFRLKIQFEEGKSI